MKLNNTYYILRHGEALSNVKSICSSWPETFDNSLTEHGVEMIEAVAKELEGKKIDVIFASDLLRAKQTTAIVAVRTRADVQYDERLREIDFGIYNGKPKAAFDASFMSEEDRLKAGANGGESYNDVLIRVKSFLHDADGQYHGKVILIVSHQCVLWLLEDLVKGISIPEEVKRNPEDTRIARGELRKIN